MSKINGLLSLRDWLAIHSDHGRGPWQDAKVHVYMTWRCGCGEKFQFSDSEREAAPGRFET